MIWLYMALLSLNSMSAEAQQAKRVNLSDPLICMGLYQQILPEISLEQANLQFQIAAGDAGGAMIFPLVLFFSGFRHEGMGMPTGTVSAYDWLNPNAALQAYYWVRQSIGLLGGVYGDQLLYKIRTNFPQVTKTNFDLALAQIVDDPETCATADTQLRRFLFKSAGRRVEFYNTSVMFRLFEVGPPRVLSEAEELVFNLPAVETPNGIQKRLWAALSLEAHFSESQSVLMFNEFQ